jgi:hypothetical protein
MKHTLLQIRNADGTVQLDQSIVTACGRDIAVIVPMSYETIADDWVSNVWQRGR